MSPKIIIDGYNVINLVQAYKDKLKIDLESARNQLIRDLQIYSGCKKIEILIVFDGSAEVPIQPRRTSSRGVEIIFSKAPLKADPVIIKMIESEQRKKRITIVTNDNAIKKTAQSFGCDLLSPQEFYKRIKTKFIENELNNKFGHEMSPQELEEWKRIFNIEDK